MTKTKSEYKQENSDKWSIECWHNIVHEKTLQAHVTLRIRFQKNNSRPYNFQKCKLPDELDVLGDL